MPDLTDSELAEIAKELDPDHPVLKALREERQARKSAERRAKFTEIAVKYPQVGLTADDFEGLSPDKWEARAERLAGLAVPQSPQPEPPKQTEVAPEAAAAFARMQQPLEGSPPLSSEKKLSLQEAWPLFKRNPAEFERLRQAGRIDLPQGTDKGGSTVFGG